MSSPDPSSSSWAADARFSRFLGASLSALRAEVPEAYAAMCGALAPRALRLDVDDEVVTIRFDPGAVVEVPSGEPAAVTLRTSRTSILAVIDAQHSLVSATLAGVLDLRGTPTDVAAFHDAFVRYLQGGVRAPSFPRLLAAFRQTTKQGGTS
jgi:hypothetical protein